MFDQRGRSEPYPATAAVATSVDTPVPWTQVAELTVGDGMAHGTKVGPLISESALKKTEHLVADALAKGATALAGGKRAAHVNGGRGWFYEPTVLEGIKGGMEIASEEIFGPVAPLQRFREEADLLKRANATEVGLAAYVFTR